VLVFRNFACFASSVSFLLFLVGCSSKIDFENDVPQRARSISQQQTKVLKASMEKPARRMQYREYVENSGTKKTLAQLQEEKRALEKRMVHIIRSNNSHICAICRKKYNMQPTKKFVAVKRKRPVKKKAAADMKQEVKVLPSNGGPQQPPRDAYQAMPEEQQPYLQQPIPVPPFPQQMPMVPVPQQMMPMQPMNTMPQIPVFPG
jgi:hypothetical protein